jgi:hypothetical protein
MKKARLIKRQDALASEEAKQPKTLKKTMVIKTVEAVTDWIESRKSEREDPRKAFAALFTQPQTQ